MSVYRTIGPLVDRILFVLVGKDEIQKSLDEFEIRPDATLEHRVTCHVRQKYPLCHFFLAVFHLILFILTDNYDMHESFQELKIGQIRLQS